jgi:hypothetical protein
MKLRRRQKRKRDQALDALASVTKTWSEWQLAKRAGKGVAKAKKVRPPSGVKSTLGSKPVRAAGAAAVAGGAVAAIARKLKGGDDEPIYTPPPPSEPVAAPAASDPPPLAIAPDPAPGTQEPAASEPAAGLAALRDAGGDAPPEEPAVAAATLPEADDAAAAVEPLAPALGDEAKAPEMFPPGPSAVDEPAGDGGEAEPEA